MPKVRRQRGPALPLPGLPQLVQQGFGCVPVSSFKHVFLGGLRGGKD